VADGLATTATPTGRASWWARLRSDMGRRIEHRGPVLNYLIVERGLKAVALVAAAIFLYTHTESGLDPVVRHVIAIFNLNAGTGFFHRIILENLLKLAGISASSLLVIGTGSLIYGLIEGSESVGLILRRRWAEYLVVLATAFFIPLEVSEVIQRPSPLRIVTLVVNVAVVIYLVRKKRLFHFDESPEDA
jgi:uncharacterized membrane protein (DUF2068 family)